MTEVITLGECLIAFVATTPGPLAEATTFERFVAGAEANVAVGLARLGHSVAFIGRIGADGFGEVIRRRLRGERVDIADLAVDPDAPTGLMFRERRVLGPAQVVYARRGSAGSRLTPAEVERAMARHLDPSPRWLHVTGITPALSVDARAATERAIESARAAGLTISLDLNLRRRLWSDEAAAPVLRAHAANVDVLLGNPDELAVLTHRTADHDPVELARAALELGPSLVVVKLGAAGALAVDRAEPADAIVRPALPLPVVVDPVGAGDAFCAGFIAARLDGADVATALEMGNACGAAAGSAVGDQTGLPDRGELAAILLAAAEAGSPDIIR
jgi:2-dehydro-3-deoxygluconokinase